MTRFAFGILAALALLMGCGGGGSAIPGRQAQTFTLTTAPAPADNPLKGFVPFAGAYTGDAAFPHSMEFIYMPLKAVQTGYTTFDWTALETQLDAIGGRGHQAVLRFYLDYPDTAYGVPDFLSGVPKYAYTDYGNGTHATSYCPDYSDTNLRTALLNFIAAFGARYDQDGRIGFVQAGLLGFWGEWHTYPHTDWTPGTTLMDQLLDAFQASLPHTQVLVREPKTGVDMDRTGLGFHDDSFCYSTLGSETWYLWPLMQAAGLQTAWRTRVLGGEVRPELQACLWDATPCVSTGQEFNTCVDTTHASWMINQGVFATQTGTQRANALAGAGRLGYSLYVDQATLQPVTTVSSLALSVRIQNQGVAPFYYPWLVQVGALDVSGTLHTWNTVWDLRTVVDAPQTWTLTVASHGLTKGTYRLVMAVPGPNGSFLRFANATQDQDRSGWLTLGSFQID